MSAGILVLIEAGSFQSDPSDSYSFSKLSSLLIIFAVPFAPVFVFYAILKTDLILAVILAIIAVPLLIFPMMLAASLVYFIVVPARRFIVKTGFTPVGLGFAVSLALSLLCMLTGSLFVPGAWIPKTTQMLFMNLIFDSLTVWVTFIIFQRAISSPGSWRIFRAVWIDLFLAVVFAMSSLYFGLLGSPQSLTIAQVSRVLIGLSPFTPGVELGPFFWVMHTAFLPTAVYLFVILVALGIKSLITLLEFLFSHLKLNYNPLNRAKALCLALSVIFGGFYFILAEIFS